MSKLHLILAVIQPLCAVAAIVLVRQLIRKGLSHRLFRSLLFFFILMFALSLWHFADDIFQLEDKSEIYEYPSYALLITGFAHIIYTSFRSLGVASMRSGNAEKSR